MPDSISIFLDFLQPQFSACSFCQTSFRDYSVLQRWTKDIQWRMIRIGKQLVGLQGFRTAFPGPQVYVNIEEHSRLRTAVIYPWVIEGSEPDALFNSSSKILSDLHVMQRKAPMRSYVSFLKRCLDLFQKARLHLSSSSSSNSKKQPFGQGPGRCQEYRTSRKADRGGSGLKT